jgi:hypothetical protein
MAFLYFLLVALGAVLLLVPAEEMDMDPIEALIQGIMLILIGAAFMVPHVVAPFFPKRTWAWGVDLVLICLGLTSCCTIPFCVALLVYWIKPETQEFFGRARDRSEYEYPGAPS